MVRGGLLEAVDHPVYPLAIAAAHRLARRRGARGWQSAAQVAAVLAGVLLVVPLYLVARRAVRRPRRLAGLRLDVHRRRCRRRVFADALSEGTFLLFWTWGLWAALRFLREGTLRAGCRRRSPGGPGVPDPARGAAAARGPGRDAGPDAAAAGDPDELAALVGGDRRSWCSARRCWSGRTSRTRGGWARSRRSPGCSGTAPTSTADAVERSRPLDPSQSAARRTVRARGQGGLRGRARRRDRSRCSPLAVVGLVAAGRSGARARAWLFLAIIVGRVVPGAGPAARHGGLLQPEARADPGAAPDRRRGRGLDRLLAAIAVPGPLARAWARGGPPRAGLLDPGRGGPDASSTRPKTLGPRQRGVRRLPHGRRLAGRRRTSPARRAGRRRHRLVALLRRAPRLHLRQPDPRPRRPERPLGRGPRGPPVRPLGLLREDPPARRRPDAGGDLPRGAGRGAIADLRLRPTGAGAIRHPAPARGVPDALN